MLTNLHDVISQANTVFLKNQSVSIKQRLFDTVHLKTAACCGFELSHHQTVQDFKDDLTKGRNAWLLSSVYQMYVI